MSETAEATPVESTEVEETEEETEPETPNFPDEMAEMSFNMLSNLINNRNSEVGKINAVKGDRQTLTDQITENSTSPEIVEAREAAEAAKLAWDEAVMALHAAVQPEVDNLLKDAEASVKDTEERVKELDAKIKPGTTYFKKMYGENLAKFLPALARLKGFSTKGAGASGRRVRGYDVEVVIDGEGTTFPNLASAAKYLEVETATLQEHFFRAAGVENLKDAPDRVDFEVEYTDTNDDGEQEQYTARVVATREVKDEAPAEDASDSE